MELRNKIARDITWILLSWSAWFVPILVIVYVAFKIMGGEVEINQQNIDQVTFFTFAYHPSKIFMLVIGIIHVSGFLPFFAKQGVTRRDYFFGSGISSVLVSLMLMISAGLVTLVENILFPVIETEFIISAEAPWYLTATVFTLNLLVYFMAGWLIGAGFYRFGGIGGMLYIAIAIVMVLFSSMFWEGEEKHPLNCPFGLSNLRDLPPSVSLMGTFLLIAVMLWIVRATTRSVRIKMK